MQATMDLAIMQYWKHQTNPDYVIDFVPVKNYESDPMIVHIAHILVAAPEAVSFSCVPE